MHPYSCNRLFCLSAGKFLNIKHNYCQEMFSSTRRVYVRTFSNIRSCYLLPNSITLNNLQHAYCVEYVLHFRNLTVRGIVLNCEMSFNDADTKLAGEYRC